MNKKTQVNKRRAKTKPIAATRIAKVWPARKNVIDARSQEIEVQEGITRYEADEGPIGDQYLAWMREQAK